MKLLVYLFLCVLLDLCLLADEIKFEQLKITNIDKIEVKELELFRDKIDFKSIEIASILQFIKSTNGFDFIDYLIRNENKSIGSGAIWDENRLLELNDIFKNKILTFKSEYDSFKKEYIKIEILHSLRVKCIGFVSKNKAMLSDENKFTDLLNPMELELYKNSKYEDIVVENKFVSAYYEKLEIKKKAFDIKHHLNLLNQIKNIRISIKEIIKLINGSKSYLRNENLDLLKKQINLNKAQLTLDELLEILELWKTNISYEKYLIEDMQNTQERLNFLAIQVLEICLTKAYVEKKAEFEKLLGPKLYEIIFVEKIEVGKIQEFSFESYDKTLNVLRGFR